VDPVPTPHRRPFGVIVVALLQLGTVVVALGSYLSGIDLPWEGTMSAVLAEHSWARVVIVVMAFLVILAAVGMWRLERWGWALMISMVGLSLAFDITVWFRDPSEGRPLALYLRMGLDVVSAFYLNSASVHRAFHREPDGGVPAPPTKPSAGRVDS
jgi:hypothetical protein